MPIKNNNDNSDVYKIINSEINDLIPKIKKDVIILEKHLNNHFLENFDDLKYPKEDYENHFLTTFYSLTKEDFKYIFNKNQITYYKQQLKHEQFIDPSYINSDKLTIVDSESNANSAGFYIDKGLVILSSPVFTKNRKFALIKYYFGDYNRNAGNEGITIYKKENNKWILYRRIGLGIG